MDQGKEGSHVLRESAYEIARWHFPTQADALAEPKRGESLTSCACAIDFSGAGTPPAVANADASRNKGSMSSISRFIIPLAERLETRSIKCNPHLLQGVALRYARGGFRRRLARKLGLNDRHVCCRTMSSSPPIGARSSIPHRADPAPRVACHDRHREGMGARDQGLTNRNLDVEQVN